MSHAFTDGFDQDEDLFFTSIPQGYIEKNPRFLRRDWLAAEIDGKLQETDKRFVLLIAEPGAGKTAFMAQLAHDHPEWLRYFIRRDQREVMADVSARSFLLRLGYQLASRHPELYAKEQLRLSVEQRIGEVGDQGQAVGAEIERFVVSPFYKQVLEIEQHVRVNRGKVVGLQVKDLYVEERLLPREDLLRLALVDPARALHRTDASQQIVILVDALDEIRYHQTAENILDWLTNCPELPENIRFVLTSRPPDETLEFLCKKQASRLTLLTIAESDPLVENDVAQFVKSLVGEGRLARALVQHECSPSEFAKRVIGKANGNLGYVDALARGIDQALAKNETNILRAVLHLEELPETLEELYAFFLLQIKATASREIIEIADPDTGEIFEKRAWPAIYQRVLDILAVAREPLDLKHIELLGDIRAGHEWVSDALHRFMPFLDAIDGRYRFYHTTLAEFLTKQPSHANKGLAVRPQQVNRRISNVLWGLFQKQWETCSDSYAIANLPWHLMAADEVTDATKLGRYHQRLLNLILNTGYLEALNAVEGHERLQQALDIAKSLPLTGDPATAIEDILWAVRRFQHQIAEEPSSLPSVIYNSLVAQNWKPDRIVAALEIPNERARIRLRFPVDLLPGLIKTLRSDFRVPFLCCDFSRDGRYFAAGSIVGDLSIWDPSSGVKLGSHEDAQVPVLFCRFMGGNDKIMSVHFRLSAKTWWVKVWDWNANALNLHHSFEVPSTVIAVSPLGNFLVTANTEIFSVETGVVLRCLPEAKLPIKSACFTPSSKIIVTVSTDEPRTLVAWDRATGDLLHKFDGHTTSVMACAATDHYLVSGGLCRLRIYDSNDQELTGFDLQTLKIWEIESGHELATIDTDSIHSCAVSEEKVIASENRYSVLIWDWKHSARPSRRTVHRQRISACALTPTDKLAASASLDGTISIWDLPRLRSKFARAHRGSITSCAASSDGRRICTGSTDHMMKIWDSSTGELLGRFDKHEAGVFSCDISSDGSSAISGSWDEYVRVWNVDEQRLIETVEEHLEVVTCCSVSPNGDFAITVAPDGKLVVVRLSDGEVLECEYTGSDLWRTCKVLPDGKTIIVAGETRMTTWIWQEGKLAIANDFSLGQPIEHGEILCCEYLSASDQAVIGLSDGRIKTLRLQPVADSPPANSEWQAHSDAVNALAITKQGGHLLSCSDDGCVKAWSLEYFKLQEMLVGVAPFKSVCGTDEVICAGDDLGNLWICSNNL